MNFSNEEMLGWIKDETAKNGFAPTRKQIAAKYGVSEVAIHKRLHRQEKEGKIIIERRIPHGISFDGSATMTPIQSQVKKMLDDGKNQALIAKTLGVSAATICEHVRNLKLKGIVGVTAVGVIPIAAPEQSLVLAAA